MTHWGQHLPKYPSFFLAALICRRSYILASSTTLLFLPTFQACPLRVCVSPYLIHLSNLEAHMPLIFEYCLTLLFLEKWISLFVFTAIRSNLGGKLDYISYIRLNYSSLGQSIKYMELRDMITWGLNWIFEDQMFQGEFLTNEVESTHEWQQDLQHATRVNCFSSL